MKKKVLGRNGENGAQGPGKNGRKTGRKLKEKEGTLSCIVFIVMFD